MLVRNIGDRNIFKRFLIKSFLQVLFPHICGNHLVSSIYIKSRQSPAYGFWDEFRLRALGLQNANYVQPISLKRMPTRSFKPDWSKMISEKFSHTALEQGLSWGLLNYVADLRQRGGGREEGRGGQPEEQEQRNHLISPLWSFIHCIGGWISVAKF